MQFWSTYSSNKNKGFKNIDRYSAVYKKAHCVQFMHFPPNTVCLHNVFNPSVCINCVSCLQEQLPPCEGLDLRLGEVCCIERHFCNEVADSSPTTPLQDWAHSCYFTLQYRFWDCFCFGWLVVKISVLFNRIFTRKKSFVDFCFVLFFSPSP